MPPSGSSRRSSASSTRSPSIPTSPTTGPGSGHAYKELVEDRDFLLVMMHGFTSAGVDEIGAAARACMGRIFAVLRRTGGTDEQLRAFVAHGMLINVLVAMRAPEHLGEGGPLADLMACAMQEFRAPVSG